MFLIKTPWSYRPLRHIAPFRVYCGPNAAQTRPKISKPYYSRPDVGQRTYPRSSCARVGFASAMTDALKTLRTNLNRARYFLDLHKLLQQPDLGAPRRARLELPRGAVVFAVGAFDAFLADVVAEVLVTKVQLGLADGQTRSLMAKASQAVPGLALELVLEDDPSTRAERIKQAVVSRLQDESWHGPKAVGKAVNYLDGSVSAVWASAEQAGFPQAARDLESWTNKRHLIVHRGEAVRILQAHARRCIRLLRVLGTAINDEGQQTLQA